MPETSLLNPAPTRPKAEPATLHASSTIESSLAQNPFQCDPYHFYSGAKRGHLLEWLRHLAIFNPGCQFVLGEPGSGKTMMINYLDHLPQDYQGPVMHFAKVAAEPHITFEILIHQLLSRVLEQMPTKIPSYQVIWEQWIERLSVQQQFAVLAVDDAHLLSGQVIEQLIQLLPNNKIRQCPVKLILFGTEMLMSHILDLEDEVQEASFSPPLHLPPLTHDETVSFLKFKLAQANLNESSLFSDQELVGIYESSQGIIGQVERQAYLRWQNRLKKPRFPIRHRWLALSLSLVMLVMVVAYIFDDSIRVWISGFTVDTFQSSQPEQMVGDNIRDLAEMIIARAQQRSSQQDTSAKNQAAQAQQVLQESSTELDQFNTVQNQVAAPKKMSSLSEPTQAQQNSLQQAQQPSAMMQEKKNYSSEPNQAKPQSMPVITAADQNQTVGKLSQPTAREKKVRPISRQLQIQTQVKPVNWVLARQSGQYTWQLLGSYELEKAQEFIAQYQQQMPNPFAIFQTRHRNKDWYVVVYGDYQGRTHALADLELMPDAVQKLKPWARSWGSIQQSLSSGV